MSAKIDELLKKYIATSYDKTLVLTADEKKELERRYLARIKEINKNMINSSKIDVNKIKKIVSPVSFTDISNKSYLELPIIKSLRVFNNIEEVFLLYTKDVAVQYEKMKKLFESKNLKVIGKEIENELNSVSTYLRELASKQQIAEENTVIDITLGLKVVGIALYKIAAERGIKAINWREEYFKEGKNIRNPFNTNLEILQEPILESLRNRRNINDFLQRAEYKALSEYYRNLGKDDCADLFEEIDKLFNFDTLLNLDIDEESVDFFKINVDKFLEFYSNYDKFETITNEKIAPLVSSLVSISKDLNDFDDFDTESKKGKLYDTTEEKIGKYNLSQVGIKYYDEAKEEITTEFKDFLSYLMYRFLRMKSSNNINEKFIRSLFESCYIEDLDTLFAEYKIENKSLVAKLEELYKKKVNYDELIEAFQFEKRFMEDIETLLMVKNSYLIIDKFGINIDLYSNMELKDKNCKIEKRELKNDPATIVKMINSKRKSYNEKEFFEIVSKSKNSDPCDEDGAFITLKDSLKRPSKEVKNIVTNYNTRKSNFKYYIECFNTMVNEEMKKIGKKPEDFIIMEKTQGNLVILKINPYYYELD